MVNAYLRKAVGRARDKVTFTIKYDKTGKEIVVSNTTGFIMMDHHKLEAMGFKSRDMFDEVTEEDKKKIFRVVHLKE